MLFYSITMFVVSIVMIVLGILIYRGNTKLIHWYHQTKVTDKEKYGRAMAKPLIFLGILFLVCGLIPFLGRGELYYILPIIIMVIGIVIILIWIYIIQRKYNKGVF